MSLSELRALVVDDNRHTRSMIRQVLRGLGFGPSLEAEDGREALAIIGAERVGLVIVDLEMAPMDGLALVRAIRASPDRLIAMLPVVVVTAHSTELKVAQARDAGATEFVTKPFSVRSLAARLEEAMVRPRPYIRTETYFGPDRRRHQDSAYAGPERRQAAPEPVAGPPKVDFDELSGGRKD